MPAPLPRRAGPRPRTTPTNSRPQLDRQPADRRLADELGGRACARAVEHAIGLPHACARPR